MNRSAEECRTVRCRPRAELLTRLEARRTEIEQTILTRVYSLEDPTETGDPAYVDGLRTAVCHAIGYAIEEIERSKAYPAPIPTPLFAQVRRAARDGVSLDTVLRRYFAGYARLGDFLMEEAKGGDLLDTDAFHRVARSQAEIFERLIDAIASEYHRESKAKSRSKHQRRTECVERLLNGEFGDTEELAYDLDAWHIGAMAAGSDADEALRATASALDRRLLAIPRGNGVVFAWFGGQRPISSGDVVSCASSVWSPGAKLSLGEAGFGVTGWRLSHRQAGAAWPIALRGTENLVCYSDAPLLSSVLNDEVLAASLSGLYLAPLMRQRDGGAVLRKTLRAYFASDRNAASAAATLGVTRQTVTNRLRTVEEQLRRPVRTWATEMEVALCLEELTEGL